MIGENRYKANHRKLGGWMLEPYAPLDKFSKNQQSEYAFIPLIFSVHKSRGISFFGANI